MINGLIVLACPGADQTNAWCWNRAGEQHAIEPELLRAIADVES
ncbi:MAG: hypothetical protein ACRES5_15480 [Pseudomonas sp.]